MGFKKNERIGATPNLNQEATPFLRIARQGCNNSSKVVGCAGSCIGYKPVLRYPLFSTTTRFI